MFYKARNICFNKDIIRFPRAATGLTREQHPDMLLSEGNIMIDKGTMLPHGHDMRFTWQIIAFAKETTC